ncbi:MAG: hypothetical protein MI741_12160, partial [Rhodospirillales bacterium]|nr:hypothetical protein [Rhodospirillales bacterium]
EQKRVRYFIGLEKFILGIYQNEALYRHALALQKEGDIDGAREAIQKTRVPAVIRHYADTSKLLGISRGEKGLIVSLNLRWLVHYTALKQQLGIEPVRINFAPTNHDPLAQSRGRFTYFIDHEDRLWEVRGEEELKAPAYGQLAGGLADIPADTDALWAVRESGVVCDQPLNVVVSPLMNRKHQKIAAGRYRLTLLFGESDGSEPSMMDVSVRIPGRREPVTREISLDSHSLHEVFDVQLTEPGVIHVIIKPISGDAKISGVMLEPLP